MTQPFIVRPDYQGRSIVNLMATILKGLGDSSNQHQPLDNLDVENLQRATNVVLLVLDGLGYSYLTEQGEGSMLHRQLQGRMTTVFPSTTATAISTFMTGLAPQQHGLTGWFTYFEEVSSVVTVLPCKTRYMLKDTDEVEINAGSLYGHTPVFDLLNVDCFVVTPAMIADSEYSLSHRGKAEITAYQNLEECFTNTRDIIQSSSNRKYIYTYWPQFDGMAHEKGVNSKDVATHFQEIDKAFSQFISDIKGSNTLVIATADHGMIDSGPESSIEIENHPALKDMLSMPLSGERRMSYCYVEAGRRDEFNQYILDNFSDSISLFESEQLLSENFFGLGAAHPQLSKRIGDFALSMNGNMTIMDTLPGESRFYHIGTHGGLSEKEMLVPLILVHA